MAFTMGFGVGANDSSERITETARDTSVDSSVVWNCISYVPGWSNTSPNPFAFSDENETLTCPDSFRKVKPSTSVR